MHGNCESYGEKGGAPAVIAAADSATVLADAMGWAAAAAWTPTICAPGACWRRAICA